MVAFLKKHDAFTMFMLGNFEAHGPVMTEAPNSGNFKLVRQGSDLVAVFCLARRGTLLVQSEVGEELFPCYFGVGRGEPVAIKGTAGEWTVCKGFWDFLMREGVIMSVRRLPRRRFCTSSTRLRAPLQKSHL